MFFKFPYTDAHQLNLDWVIKQVKRIPELAARIPTKLSELLNDTGFVNTTQAAAAAPVQSVNGQTGDVTVTGTGAVDSVNGQTGAVVLTAADVGAKPASYAAPVDSVNGQTGAVVLDADDVGALPSSLTAWPLSHDNFTTVGQSTKITISEKVISKRGKIALLKVVFNVTETVTAGEELFKINYANLGMLSMTSYYFGTTAAGAVSKITFRNDWTLNLVKAEAGMAMPVANGYSFMCVLVESGA